MTSAPTRARRIRDLLAAGRTLSFEFFPPRTDEAERQLEKAIHELAPLRPSFVSVTYGAGGSTRDRTRDIVVEICRTQPFPAMAHLTCTGHTRDEITALLDDYAANGVCNILALAGDPPADGSDPGGDFTYALEPDELVRAHPGDPRDEITALLDDYAANGVCNILALAGDPPADGSDPGGDFTYAIELVELVRAHPGDFSVGVAAHPELHPRSRGDREADRRHL